MSEEIDVKNPEELIDESLKVLSDKKDTARALKDVTTRVLEASSGDKGNWNILRKVYANKGRAWVGGDPLELDKEEPHKDAISPMFKKLLETITAVEEFDQLYILDEYFAALKEKGITITVDESKFNKADVANVDIADELNSAKAYMKTIEDYTDELKDIHTAKSEEIDFSPAKEYLSLVNLYKRGMEGKDVEDAFQDKVTLCEWTERAYNLVRDKIAAESENSEE